MDKRQKSSLRSLHLRIADELILDEDFYTALRRDKIFTNGMIDMIKALEKPRDRVYKMLELLEKRGPKAFENFVRILKENYEWLAEELEDQYSIRCQRDLEAERGRNEQTSRQYENEPTYHTNDQYRKNFNIRAVSTPTPQQRTHKQTDIPTQESVSAGYNQKDSARFFPTTGCNNNFQQYQQRQQKTKQQVSYDITTVPLSNSFNLDQNEKEYRDACLSPISIINTSRKMLGSPTCPKSDYEEDIQSETDTCDQAFDQINSQTAAVISSTDGDVEKQFTCTTKVESGGSVKDMSEENYINAPGIKRLEENDDVDVQNNVGLDENDDDFPTSEAYYDEVRRRSSRTAYLDGEFHHELKIQDDENETVGQEISYEQSETIQYEERMKTLYDKLTTITSVNENTDYVEDGTVTWEMIESETDKLINRLENSDDLKMIKKCYEHFPEKERRKPLNVCIETLLDEKKELDKTLEEKQVEINMTESDLYKEQEKKSILNKQLINTEKKLANTESQNDDMKTSLESMKTSLDNLRKDVDLKLNQMAEKDTKIQDLESKLREFQCDQQKRLGATTRKGTFSQKRILNAQGHSPRKQSSVIEPRISMKQGDGKPSPRSVTTAIRETQTNRKQEISKTK